MPSSPTPAQARERLQERIGRRFSDGRLLELALTHPSADGASEPGRNNERMEFLGDAVLGLSAARLLFERFPDASEGRLTKLKGRLVSADALEPIARELDLGACLRLGPPEEASGGRDKKGLLVDALEALIAAIYLDGGSESADAFVRRWILADGVVEEASADLTAANPKSALQELLQRRGEALPVYRILEESGPPHQRTFLVEVELPDGIRERAQGRTKRAAEQDAARAALERTLEGEGNENASARVE